MIAVRDLAMRLGAFTLQGVNFTVPDGVYAVLMGKTGSGKTSIVEAICGLRPIAAGAIEINGQPIHALDPAQRGVAYVPQDGALFKTMTVRQQVTMPMRIRGWSRPDAEARAREVCDMLGIAHLLTRRPHGLSGGERQRVALARAVAFRPRIVCLDEPFSALDEPTREAMYSAIDTLRTHTPITALHVTHSTTEAERLADLRFQLHDGRVVPAPPPAAEASARRESPPTIPPPRRLVHADHR